MKNHFHSGTVYPGVYTNYYAKHFLEPVEEKEPKSLGRLLRMNLREPFGTQYPRSAFGQIMERFKTPGIIPLAIGGFLVWYFLLKKK